MKDSSNNPIEVDSQLKDELRDDLVRGGFGCPSEDSLDDSEVQTSVLDKFKAMFGAKGDTPLKGHDWVVHLPSSLMDRPSGSSFSLYGIVRDETESIYVLDYEKYRSKRFFLGTATVVDDANPDIDFPEASPLEQEQADISKYPYSCRLYGSISNGTPNFRLERLAADGLSWDNVQFRIKLFDNVTNLFSRNSGLLESAEMLKKTAVLIGCGSVCSFVALELARSGVGRFILCDSDILEIHNICRHQCGFDDLGKYKVDAVKDKVLNVNPNAEIVTFRTMLQDVPKSELLPFLGEDAIIIGGGDNRYSADLACKLAVETKSSFISTCCWTRAFAGEIFYWTPTSDKSYSCYSCALGGLIDDSRPESHATYFGEDGDQDKLAFEPGIAVDIDFVTIIAVKLALDLINKNNPNYTPRVVDYLKQYTWVCNTNNPKIGGERAEIFPTPLWITNNLSVGKDKNCPYCGNAADQSDP